jgi:hypothetical protein
MVMPRDQKAGKNGNIQIGNKSFETVEQFKYLGTTLTDQNSIHEEIKNKLKSGNACYHSMQNLLSSSLLFKSVKIEKQRVFKKRPNFTNSAPTSIERVLRLLNAPTGRF